jgi:hypothetical protein
MTSQNIFSMTDEQISQRVAGWKQDSVEPDYRGQMIEHLLANKPAPEAFAAFHQQSAMSIGESEIVLTALADNLAKLRSARAIMAGQ